MADQQSITLTKGDPLYSAYIWRQDSLTLARLRPIIEEIVVLADEPCLTAVGPYTCLNADPDGEPMQPVCLACRLKQLRARLYGYKTSTPDPGDADSV